MRCGDEQKLGVAELISAQEANTSEKMRVQNLSLASKKISKMNILIIEKLSSIVKEYFHSIEKLQSYYQQIETLVAYNKSLIETLGLFEEQEQKLLVRLRKMEEINIQYMKEYCHVKGRQFKLPQMPEYTSIFFNINLQDFAFICPKLQPPVVDLNYKNELMLIIKNYFLTTQSELGNRIEARMNIQANEGVKAQLAVIYEMIKNYQNNLANHKQQQSKYFDLLQLRSQIRRKLEKFYDKQNSQQIKPNYQQQQMFIDKIINLHSRLQDSNQEALLECLSQQKEQRKEMELKRVKIQSEILQRYKHLQIKNNENKTQLIAAKQSNKELQIQIQKLQTYKKLVAECDEKLEVKQKKIEQLGKEIEEANKNYKETDNLLKQALNTNLQLKLQIQLLSKKIQIDFYEVQTDPDVFIQRLQQNLRQNQQQVREQGELVGRLRKEISNFVSQKQAMERLSTIVYQSICMCTYLDIHQSVRQKLMQISKKLQVYLQDYQQTLQWNIIKDAPDFFKDHSVITNMEAQISYQLDKSDVDLKMGYSVDDETNLIKAKKRNALQEENRMVEASRRPILRTIVDKSMGINRVMDLQINGGRELSLDYSEVSQNKDDYDQLYKLYQQSIQCLQMEEKKTKNKQIQYQKYVEIIYRKQREDPEKYSLQKQLVYLTKLTLDQKQTIETERKEYNEIFKDFQQEFKSKLTEELKSLKSVSYDAKDKSKSMREVNRSII